MMRITKTNKIVLYSVILIWLVTGILVFGIARANAQNVDNRDNIMQNVQMFAKVISLLKTYYVNDVNSTDMVYNAIEGMLNNLDPHTNFFKPTEFSDFTTSTKGEFGGLGITIEKQGDYVIVVSPIEGTPAYKQGILAGDRIVKVNGENIVGLTSEDAIKRMRGEKGTDVVLTIQRPGNKNLLDFKITRDIIKIKSIPYAFRLDNGVGYIRIRQFNENTTTELREQLDRLEKEGIKGLLIDLRFNPGGLLDEAISTVNEFIGKDKLVVFTKGRLPQANREYFTTENRMRSGYPVVVLINEASASASEIFAGSLQDWDKGLIVGKTSFGKGSVQQLFPLDNGYGIKITTSKYYIKSGRCIHKDINDKLLLGKNVTEEDKKNDEEKTKKAIFKTEKGRTVFGGGGITPDITIEQSRLTNMEIEIRRLNIVFDYGVDYYAKHKNEITKNYDVTDSQLKEFLTFAKEKGLKYNQADLDSSSTFIKASLRSDILGKKFGDEYAYQTNIVVDTQLMEAIKLFDDYKSLDAMFKHAEAIKKKR